MIAPMDSLMPEQACRRRIERHCRTAALCAAPPLALPGENDRKGYEYSHVLSYAYALPPSAMSDEPHAGGPSSRTHVHRYSGSKTSVGSSSTQLRLVRVPIQLSLCIFQSTDHLQRFLAGNRKQLPLKVSQDPACPDWHPVLPQLMFAERFQCLVQRTPCCSMLFSTDSQA